MGLIERLNRLDRRMLGDPRPTRKPRPSDSVWSGAWYWGTWVALAVTEGVVHRELLTAIVLVLVGLPFFILLGLWGYQRRLRHWHAKQSENIEQQ